MKTLRLVLLLVSVGILALAGGVFARYGYEKVSVARAQKIVQKSTERLSEIKSFEYSAKAKIEQAGPPLPGTSAVIAIDGVSDFSSAQNPKSRSLLTVMPESFQTTLLPKDAVISLETRHLGKIYYLRLAISPELLPFLPLQLPKDWIKIDFEEARKSLLPSLPGVPKGAEQVRLSEEQKAKLKEIIIKAKLLKITAVLPGEKLDDIDTYRYGFVIDKNALIDFAWQLIALQLELMQQIQPDQPVDKEALGKANADFRKKLEEQLALIVMPKGEIWISKADLLPRKISLVWEPTFLGQTTPTGKLGIEFIFKSFNQPVEVQIPFPTKSLEEVMGALFGDFFGGIPAPLVK
ncbi:MAG: hypothetical protein A2745_01735 [Candidatus Harrisonbacteria bacterium RIFCSPHIGHO2_01_FULL_44_13]|uniref:Uncharacterized protein n=1 Tax=Candidatus Harrisonbacteria bacterium RIFCSPLOWO2_01_FULL_44_18 TaxID=1798407 RepID=A0A1G1ZKW7_9BACT|nr:MAG: hypothetical protein A2745_01735 [Candidatus Harrisonbacteria bacterium RIFCSPHIGHO2_01_FULL_44_13]OGY65194.1 MAG: hypothetical protein A3A16_00695 [Candidatus Harrisonbacteria bacterium RIFCSPLOWO2_01_FULL_44_18]